jgi:Zn2+/Cd2+-exporting ATPase
MLTRQYRVHGLHCAEETRAIEAALGGLVGVRGLQFDVLAERLVLQADPATADSGQIEAAIASLGMRAEPWTEVVGQGQVAQRRMWLAVASGSALLLAMAVHVYESGSVWHALIEEHDGPMHPGSTSLFTVAALFGLATTVPRAWRSVRQGRLDMNVLVMVAITGAVVLGEWSEGATVASLFAIANALESWSAARARQAVTGLMRLTPHQATVLHHDHEHTMPVEHVQPDARVLVRPGERVPVDGEILGGMSALDESALSGESVPVLKHVGDAVYAGTLNGTGALEIRCTKRAAESAIARMIALVDAARLRRTSTERWIERFARLYTPIVIAVAVGIAVVPPLLGVGSWAEWFYRGLVTTLIACPCALVISTPVTIVAALASAARAGVLVKGGASLEVLARVSAFAFDKTGVMTEGQPVVEVLEPLGGRDEADVLARVLAIEAKCEHPLARAIVAFARSRGVPGLVAADVRALPGRGAEGSIDGATFWIGSKRLARAHNVDDPEVAARAATLEARGLTVVLCGHDTTAWALVGLRDAVRPDGLAAVDRLRRAGPFRLLLLTGDNAAAGTMVGAALGIEDVRSELLPEDKEAVVGSLQAAGERVAMVGDGVNDTPAMAAAAVGITVGTRSTDAALETADIVIATDDLERVAWILEHARRALAVVQQNVWIAIGAKVAFVAMAIAGHATLWMAVAADTGATIVVTLNGLRLLAAVPVSSLAWRAPVSERQTCPAVVPDEK